MSKTILTFTKTVIISADTSARKVITGMTEQGYTLTGAEAEGKGHFVSLCENCGLPLFSDDSYNLDTEGVYWHVNCPEGEKHD